MIECPVCGSLKIRTNGQFHKCMNCQYTWKKGCPSCGRNINDNTVKRHR